MPIHEYELRVYGDLVIIIEYRQLKGIIYSNKDSFHKTIKEWESEPSHDEFEKFIETTVSSLHV
jgi:hypothetical protein